VNAELLGRWSAATRCALRALASGDGEALLAAIAERGRLLEALAADGPSLAPDAAQRLLELDGEIGDGVVALRESTARELGAVRHARERLRAQSGGAQPPRLASQRT
jgi:hypothetical protein